jgi:hypothetical protein
MAHNPTIRTIWPVACSFAEFGSIALAALWWVAMDLIEPSPTTATAKVAMILAKGAAGAIEGIILGYVQATVLRRDYPLLLRRGWVVATTALAVIGWLLGSAPSILIAADPASVSPPFEPSLGMTALFATGFGLILGALFGAAQWLVFRLAAHGAAWWILANMAGWAAALPIIYLAASIGDGSPNPIEIATRGLIGGLAAGLLFGIVSGLWFSRITPKR